MLHVRVDGTAGPGRTDRALLGQQRSGCRQFGRQALLTGHDSRRRVLAQRDDVLALESEHAPCQGVADAPELPADPLAHVVLKLPGLQKRRIQPGLRLRCSGLGRLADLVGADNVAHHVSLIAVQSDAAATLLPGQPVQAVKHVEVIGQTARAAMGELRRLLGVLRTPASAGRQPPDTAPLPSVSQLGKVLDQVREAGISVDLRVEGSTARLAPAVDLAAYRIVQEALTNTVRHSGADKAAVTLRYEPG